MEVYFYFGQPKKGKYGIRKKCSGKKEFCLGPALHKYFAYKQSGRDSEGWNEFLMLTSGVSNVIWPSKACLNRIIELHDAGEEITPPTTRSFELMSE